MGPPPTLTAWADACGTAAQRRAHVLWDRHRYGCPPEAGDAMRPVPPWRPALVVHRLLLQALLAAAPPWVALGMVEEGQNARGCHQR